MTTTTEGSTTSWTARVAAIGERSPITAVWVGVLAFAFGPILVAAADAPGAVLTFLRLSIRTALLATLAWLQLRRTKRRAGWNGWRWTIIAGVAFAVHQVCFMSALQQTSVVDVTLMNTLAPLVVAVLAVPLFGERPGVKFRLWS